MKNFTTSTNTIKISIIIVLMHFSAITRSQSPDNTKPITHFTGSVGITNNGISVVPTFTFDKPAVVLLMSVWKKRLSFEPDVRFTLDVKRGGVALWWRYKILMNGKFRLNAGAHPAINFIVTADSAGESKKPVLQTQKFLGAELVPSYMISKNVSVGFYYLYAHGLQLNGPRNVHFITVNSNFSYIKITRQYFLQWTPQFYYLNIDKKDGIYFTSSTTLLKTNSPFSLQSTINKTLKTNIPGDEHFLWNLTLFYTFKD
jgi:hypothetical protein